jgi:proteasome lid subunit RPN8/RPN11
MPIEIPHRLRDRLYARAQHQAPREACGLIVRSEAGRLLFYAAANLAEQPEEQFRMDPRAWVLAAELGEVVAIWHSHPNASAHPSMADRAQCETTGLPWVITAWPSGVVMQVEPQGWQAPYVGREFHWGVMDCYTLIQDWYRRELHVDLPDFERRDGFWHPTPEHPRGQNIYLDNLAAAGFVRVQGDSRRGDMVVMQVLADCGNHAGVYLGDGSILHHLYGRLSTHDVYGGYWARHTLAICRHQSQMQGSTR